MKKFLAVAILTLVAACAGNLPSPTAPAASPEAKIKTASDTHAAASTLGTVLLKNGAITVTQAKGFSALLHASSNVLDDAGKTLFACRANTGSTPKTVPDPCALGVADLIRLAADGIASVYATLSAK